MRAGGVMRYITLADGRKIGLGKYVAAWRTCLQLPPETHIGRGISGFGQSAGEALSDLRYGLHDRINRHIPGYGRGRKWHADWQRAALQASHALNTPRLAIHWLPADLMRIPRFRDRVAQSREF